MFYNQNLYGTPDNYKKYLDKFIAEFLPVIKNDKELFIEIIKPILVQKSWRKLNREVRYICNVYCYDNNIMSDFEFQTRWFYEQVMSHRSTWGLGSPWLPGYGPNPTENPACEIKIKKEKIISNENKIKKEKINGCENITVPSEEIDIYKIPMNGAKGLTRDEKIKYGNLDMSIEWDRNTFNMLKTLYA